MSRPKARENKKNDCCQTGGIKMNRMVPIRKQSKKAKKKYYTQQRGSWNGVNPVSRKVPNGKTYSRTKSRNEARSLISYDGKERAAGAFALC